jgi:hypothetical protein
MKDLDIEQRQGVSWQNEPSQNWEITDDAIAAKKLLGDMTPAQQKANATRFAALKYYLTAEEITFILSLVCDYFEDSTSGEPMGMAYWERWSEQFPNKALDLRLRLIKWTMENELSDDFLLQEFRDLTEE